VSLYDLPLMMLPAIEEALVTALSITKAEPVEDLYHILAYHMGWEGEGAGIEARGKRIRPLLVTLTCAAAGGEWQASLPAAVAAELVHNFSLIHDDIEDNSPLRRGRETVWQRWGIPLAINAGDTLLTLAHLSLLELEKTCSHEITIKAANILQTTCLKLTQGQHLDIAYQDQSQLSLDAYWTMVGGKTATLLSACTGLGALAAGATQAVCTSYEDFGYALGLAFQVQDDFLGIWGSQEQTGKSNISDLVTGKKTLPVLMGIHKHGKFYERWKLGEIGVEEAPAVIALLEQDGVKETTREVAHHWTLRAVHSLEKMQGVDPAAQSLLELADKLLNRQT
jgi:geranylgeranyl diphosphate synthase type I